MASVEMELGGGRAPDDGEQLLLYSAYELGVAGRGGLLDGPELLLHRVFWPEDEQDRVRGPLEINDGRLRVFVKQLDGVHDPGPPLPGYRFQQLHLEPIRVPRPATVDLVGGLERSERRESGASHLQDFLEGCLGRVSASPVFSVEAVKLFESAFHDLAEG